MWKLFDWPTYSGLRVESGEPVALGVRVIIMGTPTFAAIAALQDPTGLLQLDKDSHQRVAFKESRSGMRSLARTGQCGRIHKGEDCIKQRCLLVTYPNDLAG